eukprot:TRINITY_DN8355_c0_g1_i1.p1 TRINITY_DN8355_c0_g1~~TRINITY_DN8355_c0_g1_i1.p1  ORF type:complete len:239 (+),score=40.35 TRINITY_DN8355_c0_g1_i1:145-861(+)
MAHGCACASFLFNAVLLISCYRLREAQVSMVQEESIKQMTRTSAQKTEVELTLAMNATPFAFEELSASGANPAETKKKKPEGLTAEAPVAADATPSALQELSVVIARFKETKSQPEPQAAAPVATADEQPDSLHRREEQVFAGHDPKINMMEESQDATLGASGENHAFVGHHPKINMMEESQDATLRASAPVSAGNLGKSDIGKGKKGGKTSSIMYIVYALLGLMLLGCCCRCLCSSS